MENSGKIITVPVILLLLAMLVALLPIPKLGSPARVAPSEVRIIEVISNHAWKNHGTEVNSAFDCLKSKGSARSFKTFGFKNTFGDEIPSNVWLCFDGNDWFSIITTHFEKVEGGNTLARLITAYKVSVDFYPKISDYVAHIIQKWNAIEINYILEAGNILIVPK